MSLKCERRPQDSEFVNGRQEYRIKDSILTSENPIGITETFLHKHTSLEENMRRILLLITLLGIVFGTYESMAADTAFRRLPLSEYRDKMKAAWIGQMAGVGWGAPTEFRYQGKIIPADKMPKWEPSTVNQYEQDDIYVEMTFLRTLEQYGFKASIRQAAIDFADSGFPLWHANYFGRENLRDGIAPPDSGHPKFNAHADDIDYQIESDYAGAIAPGLPNTIIALGEKFGRLMNYGDGLYGGQLFGGMYAEAYFENDPVKIVEAGLRCIPEKSQYAEAIRDVLAWYKANPDSWEKTWELVDQKYQKNPDYRRASCSGKNAEFNIDAKINGAYVVMGILYGKRDLDQTILIACRCGQDSDCNPSSAGGVIFSTVGFKKLPERFISKLDETKTFSHTAYTFPKLIAVCEKLAREAVVAAGGKIEKDAKGEEVFVIPVQQPKPTVLEQCWEPGPIADSRFTKEEMAKITKLSASKQLVKDLDAFAKGWILSNCGKDMDPGFKKQLEGKKNVFVTHPLDRNTPCVLSKKVAIPAGKKSSLKLVVGHHPKGDWKLIVKADGKELYAKAVGPETASGGWMEATVDLSDYAGKTVQLELLNQPTGWSNEAAYWAEIAIVH